jgi:hypothetical protein
VFENRVQGKILGPKTEEVKDAEKIELINLDFSRNIIRLSKS